MPMIGVPFTARMEGERERAPGSGPRAAGFRVCALENQVQERVCMLVCRDSQFATVDRFSECRAVNHSAMGGFPVKRTSGEFWDHSTEFDCNRPHSLKPLARPGGLEPGL